MAITIHSATEDIQCTLTWSAVTHASCKRLPTRSHSTSNNFPALLNSTNTPFSPESLLVFYTFCRDPSSPPNLDPFITPTLSQSVISLEKP